VIAHAACDLRIAVAGQVDQPRFVPQREEIYELRAARGFARARELPAVNYHVDCTGFSGIGSAGKSDFRTFVRHELVGRVGALDEAGFWVVRHGYAPWILCIIRAC
jgi:hypothetical protein